MTQYADLLAELGAQNAEDLSYMTAPELAPMPIIHAKRLIRRAAEAVAEAATYDQVRVERELRAKIRELSVICSVLDCCKSQSSV